jgi:UDP-N-acetylglucosamine 2-epimerase (non-hydrolysing)
VSIRTSTERPEALDSGIIVIGGVTEETVLASVNLAVSRVISESVNDYLSTNVSDKVIRIIQGYTSIVNRSVWRKSI